MYIYVTHWHQWHLTSATTLQIAEGGSSYLSLQQWVISSERWGGLKGDRWINEHMPTVHIVQNLWLMQHSRGHNQKSLWHKYLCELSRYTLVHAHTLPGVDQHNLNLMILTGLESISFLQITETLRNRLAHAGTLIWRMGSIYSTHCFLHCRSSAKKKWVQQ